MLSLRLLARRAAAPAAAVTRAAAVGGAPRVWARWMSDGAGDAQEGAPISDPAAPAAADEADDLSSAIDEKLRPLSSLLAKQAGRDSALGGAANGGELLGFPAGTQEGGASLATAATPSPSALRPKRKYRREGDDAVVVNLGDADRKALVVSNLDLEEVAEQVMQKSIWRFDGLRNAPKQDAFETELELAEVLPHLGAVTLEYSTYGDTQGHEGVGIGDSAEGKVVLRADMAHFALTDQAAYYLRLLAGPRLCASGKTLTLTGTKYRDRARNRDLVLGTLNELVGEVRSIDTDSDKLAHLCEGAGAEDAADAAAKAQAGGDTWAYRAPQDEAIEELLRGTRGVSAESMLDGEDSGDEEDVFERIGSGGK